MSQTTKQILITVVSGVITAVIVGYMRQRVTPPPVADNKNQNWWE